MQILDRYILKELIRFLGGSLTLFTGVGLITKIIETLKYVQKYNGDASTIWLYYIYNIPFMVTIMIAPCFLLSISYVASRLIQNRELTVIRSAGRSIKRAMIPSLIFSFLFSFAVLAFNEYIAYPSNFRAYAKQNALRGRSLDFHAWRNRYEFSFRSKNRFFYIGTFYPKEKRMLRVHLVEFDKVGSIKRIIRSEEAYIQPHEWLLKKAEIISFKNGAFQNQVYYKETKADIPEDFSIFQNTFYNPQEANIFKLLEMAQFKKETGDSSIEFEVDFYWHLSFPFICFFFTIIGITVTIKTNGSLTYSLSTSVLCAILYFLMMFYTKTLGTSYIVSPLLAGSMGNAVMGSIAVYCWFRFIE